jgi:hypothetical protein
MDAPAKIANFMLVAWHGMAGAGEEWNLQLSGAETETAASLSASSAARRGGGLVEGWKLCLGAVGRSGGGRDVAAIGCLPRGADRAGWGTPEGKKFGAGLLQTRLLIVYITF